MIGGAITDAAFSSARLLRLYARISDADDAIPACAALCWTSPCAASWWSRMRRMNRQRSC